MHLYEIIRQPITTEKMTGLVGQNKYALKVEKDANKSQIKLAVEKAFKVNVVSVNVITMPSKPRGFGRFRGHRSPWKKAIVTLKPGDKIEFFEGV